MNLVRTYTRCAAALTALGITSFASASYSANDTAPLLAVVGLPAALIAWWLSARAKFLLPRWVVNGLLSLALLYAFVRVTARIDVETIAELVVFIQIIKIGDRRTPRDDAQILSLAVFLAIAAMLTSNGFWVGLQLIAFVPLLITTVMLFQIYSGWASTNAPAGGLTFGPRFGRQLRATIGFATMLAGVMAAFVFIIMPRGIGENALGRSSIRSAGHVTGFTDQVKLGDRSIISVSQKVVMEVLIRSSGTLESDPTGNLGNSENVFYLRGVALDQYRNGGWTVDPAREDSGHFQSMEQPLSEVPIGQGSPIATTVEQQFTIHSIATKAPLFAIWRPVKLENLGRDTSRIKIDSWAKTIERHGAPGPFQYTVLSTPTEGFAEPEKRTAASFPSARIHDLAVRILTSANIDPDPATRPIDEDSRVARAIESYLRASYTYTLVEQPPGDHADPIEHFLFDTKEGHCEYFASAMAALCRSVGVNARVIAGYIAAEFNAATGRYVIREANAHAWIEAESGEGRWRRYDPTPPADLERIHKPRPGLFGRLRRVVESAEYAWNASVVSFDEGARQRLLGPEDDSRPGLLSRLDRLTERIRIAGPLHLLRSALIGFAVFFAIAGAGVLIQAMLSLAPRVRSWPALLAGRRKYDRRTNVVQARFYRRLLELLARRGVAKPDWRPPLDHAALITDQALSSAASRLAALYYRVRFGDHPLSESELADAARLLQTIEHPPANRPTTPP